jgi:hypothetical protein
MTFGKRADFGKITKNKQSIQRRIKYDDVSFTMINPSSRKQHLQLRVGQQFREEQTQIHKNEYH